MSSDPGALRVVPQNAEEVWPYRQKDLLQQVNKRINPASINGHDVICINAELDTLKSHPEFAYKPHRLASPQYSEEFINWIVDQHRTEPHFFARMREAYNGDVKSSSSHKLGVVSLKPLRSSSSVLKKHISMEHQSFRSGSPQDGH